MEKRIIACILVVAGMAAFAGCGNNQESAVKKDESSKDKKALVAYFSYFDNTDFENIKSEKYDALSAASITEIDGVKTGNTKAIADMIIKKTGGDKLSITTSKKYTADYDETVDLAKEEQKDNIRPELSSKIENLDQYDTIFIGFPSWWGDMPMAMYSFFDEYDFSGKKIVPFVTSGGSGFSDTIKSIKKLEPDAEVADGLEVYQDDVSTSEEAVSKWLKGLGY